MRALRPVEHWPEDETSIGSLVRQSLDLSSSVVDDAWTLPPRAYMSQEFFDLEMEKVFKPGWICVGHVSQIPKVGDYFTMDLFGEPIVIVRGPDKVRALSSVCLHRWAPIVSGAGNTKILSCPFHKWGYALDGRLLGAPFMDRAKGFPPKDYRLPEFRLEIVEALGLIFVTLNQDISPISERIASLVARAEAEGWDLANKVIVDVVDQDNAYNWKIQVETYMEYYHHIGAHKNSLEAESPGGRSWCEEQDHDGTWSIAHGGIPANWTEEQIAEKPPGSLILVYPLLMIGRSKKRASFRILFPVGPNRTKSRIFMLMTKEEAEAPDFEKSLAEKRAKSAIINREDNEVNDLQQLGAGSAVAKVGRFSHLEACSWHLAEHIRKQLRSNA